MPFPPPVSIKVTPVGLNFGNVIESTSAPAQSISILSTGSMTANIFVTPADARFVCTPSGNFSLPPGATQVISVVFNANTVLGPVTSEFVGFQGQPTVGPPLVFQANILAGGSIAWSVSPNPYDFGSLKIGLTGSHVFTINNNDPTTPLVINTITPSETEFAVSGLTLPATIAPLGSATFLIVCTAEIRGVVSYPHAVTITPNTGAPMDISLQYEGFVIVPAFTLTGLTQGVLFGLGGIWDGISQNYVAQSLSSLPCEADASLMKMHDFGAPSDYTYTNRFFMRTECFGAVPVTLFSTGVISDQVTTHQDTKVRDATNDSLGIPTSLIFDLETNGEIHNLKIQVLANSGILSMIYYIPTYETRGSVYELA